MASVFDTALEVLVGAQPGKISRPLAMPENNKTTMPVASAPVAATSSKTTSPFWAPLRAWGRGEHSVRTPSYFILRAPCEARLVSRLLNKGTEAQLCLSGSGSHSEKAEL